MKGRDKCELLNEIRQKIADENDIDFVIYECTFEGDCTGTCPKCEAELKYLEEELAKKQARGEKIKLDGIFTLEPVDVKPGCDVPIDEPLAGDIAYPPDDELPGNVVIHEMPEEPDFIDKDEELQGKLP